MPALRAGLCRALGILALGLVGLALPPGPGGAQTAPDAPQRVVSMNLCTDQLALLLAAPGQLLSVSDLARDPYSSPLAAAAQAVPINHGGAEEIYLLRPDLVLAGTYSDPAVVSMLRRLGLRVAQIDLVQGLSDVPARLAEVGALLDREATAQSLIRQFETDLAALSGAPDGPRTAFYFPNGYTLGTGTLGHEILRHAGFRHIAAELGRDTSGRLPLELMILADPDLVLRNQRFPGASRSEAVLDHPALAALTGAGAAHETGPDWMCGTPRILDALRDLALLRAEMETPP
jgi:iron complex transport system substrate-binding protein